MGNKYTIGEKVIANDDYYDTDMEWLITDLSVDAMGIMVYDVINIKDENHGHFFYESEIKELVLPETKPNRIKAMYAYTKLNKALIHLSAICQWGDAKHGAGPVRKDVDYKAKQQAHFTRLLAGETHDQESGIDHRIALAFNCLAELQVELEEKSIEELVSSDLSAFTKEYKND